MNEAQKTITIFGSRYPQPGTPPYETARHLGRLLAESGYNICTGGYSGIMEAASRGAREANGHTIGITVETFSGTANAYVLEEIRMPTLFARLERLITLGRAYVVFPGGTGTIAELSLVWNLAQMKQFENPRPIFLLGPKLKELLAAWKATTEIPSSDYNLIHFVDSPEGIIEQLKSFPIS